MSLPDRRDGDQPSSQHADSPVAPQRPRSGIACAGNWIVDIVHGVERWPREGDLVRILDQSVGVGGGAANVASDLASFGAPFPLAAIGCLGDDDHGRVVLAHVQRLGLDDRWLRSLPGSATGHTHVISVRGGSRSFFYHPGANDRFEPAHVPIAELGERGFKLFYLGYLLLLAAMDTLLPDGQTPASLLLRNARAAGMATCVDLVSEQAGRFATLLAPALPHIDVLVINETEAALASGVAVHDAAGRLSREQVQRAAQSLLAAGVQRVVVVHSPEGALWLPRAGGAVWAEPRPVPPDEIASAVGAGDAFCAALLYGLHEDWPAETSLRIAHRAAAACLRGRTATDAIPPMAELIADDLADAGHPAATRA